MPSARPEDISITSYPDPILLKTRIQTFSSRHDLVNQHSRAIFTESYRDTNAFRTFSTRRVSRSRSPSLPSSFGISLVIVIVNAIAISLTHSTKSLLIRRDAIPTTISDTISPTSFTDATRPLPDRSNSGHRVCEPGA